MGRATPPIVSKGTPGRADGPPDPAGWSVFGRSPNVRRSPKAGVAILPRESFATVRRTFGLQWWRRTHTFSTRPPPPTAREVDPSGRGEPTMGDAPTTHAGVAMDGTDLEPMLVLTFSGHGNGGTQRRRIPREGLLLGRDAEVFDEAFDDPRMSARHAEVRIEA